MRLATTFALGLAAVTAGGCAATRKPTPAIPRTSARGNDSPAPSTLPATLMVTLKPVAVEGATTAHVHVDIVVPETVRDSLGKSTPLPPEIREWHCVSVQFTNLTVTDDRGPIATSTESFGFSLNRGRVGPVHVAYDVPASSTPTSDPLAPMVLDDRFRGSGEHLIALPIELGNELVPTTLTIDGSAIRAPNGASTLGVGSVRNGDVHPAALIHSAYISASLGTAKFETDVRDEAAWLGYTAFDARSVAAEIAEIRGAVGELFEESGTPWTTLFVSQARPLGSFSTLARAGGLLVQLGPSEPWGAPLRLAITHEIVRTWIGGELRFATPANAPPAANAWFDGVARFEATRALSRLGRLTPDEARAIVSGEMSIALTSPYRGKSNADVAARAASDPTARGLLVARGALYALRANALLRATKKAASLDGLLLPLLERARNEKGNEKATTKTKAPLPLDAWTNALSAALGDRELAAFHAAIDAGSDPSLPPSALGACFHEARGTYVAFTLGFDEAATIAAFPRALVSLDPKGPAAKAGLKAGDVLVALEEKGGDLAAKVVVTVQRDGKEMVVSYAPEGAKSAGPTFVRVKSLKDDQCGDVL